MKLRRGDPVIVIYGKDKGKTGTIQKAFPKTHKVIVDGVNVRKKHQKPTQQNPGGSIVEIYAPLDVSNVAYYDSKTKKPTKIGYKFDKNGKKVRFMKATGAEIK